ncbi:hypothetical protein BD413DRAFT_137891 [Trametes elegans]|nr:hypothetical protein BD413DRAFT_137891 [Trametes elegans]
MDSYAYAHVVCHLRLHCHVPLPPQYCPPSRGRNRLCPMPTSILICTLRRRHDLAQYPHSSPIHISFCLVCISSTHTCLIIITIIARPHVLSVPLACHRYVCHSAAFTRSRFDSPIHQQVPSHDGHASLCQVPIPCGQRLVSVSIPRPALSFCHESARILRTECEVLVAPFTLVCLGPHMPHYCSVYASHQSAYSITTPYIL